MAGFLQSLRYFLLQITSLNVVRLFGLKFSGCSYVFSVSEGFFNLTHRILHLFFTDSLVTLKILYNILHRNLFIVNIVRFCGRYQFH